MVVDRRAVAARLAEWASPVNPPRLAPQARSGAPDGAEVSRLPAFPSGGPDREWICRRPIGPEWNQKSSRERVAGRACRPETPVNGGGWGNRIRYDIRHSSGFPHRHTGHPRCSSDAVHPPARLVGRFLVQGPRPSRRCSPSVRTSVDPDLSHRGGDAVNAERSSIRCEWAVGVLPRRMCLRPFFDILDIRGGSV